MIDKQNHKHPCERHWFFISWKQHKWNHGEIVEWDHARAIEKYTCKRCGETHHVILGG